MIRCRYPISATQIASQKFLQRTCTNSNCVANLSTIFFQILQPYQLLPNTISTVRSSTTKPTINKLNKIHKNTQISRTPNNIYIHTHVYNHLSIYTTTNLSLQGYFPFSFDFRWM